MIIQRKREKPNNKLSIQHIKKWRKDIFSTTRKKKEEDIFREHTCTGHLKHHIKYEKNYIAKHLRSGYFLDDSHLNS